MVKVIVSQETEQICLEFVGACVKSICSIVLVLYVIILLRRYEKKDKKANEGNTFLVFVQNPSYFTTHKKCPFFRGTLSKVFKE